MLTNKLLAAVGIAGALLVGASTNASANPWRPGFVRPAPVVVAPAYRPVYMPAPVYRPVVVAPAYRPVYSPVVVAPPVYVPPPRVIVVAAPAYRPSSNRRHR